MPSGASQRKVYAEMDASGAVSEMANRTTLARSESWEPQTAPTPWHSRARGGAVHGIRTLHSARDCVRPGVPGPLLLSHGSAGVSIDNFAEQLPRLAFEPHHLHLGNGGEVGRGRIDLDTGQKAVQL